MEKRVNIQQHESASLILSLEQFHQGLETGCPKLAILKNLGIFFKGGHNVPGLQPFKHVFTL